MIDISLRPRSDGRGTLVLALGSGFRAVFLALAAIVALAMGTAGTISVVAIVFLLVLVLGAAYEERWTFDAIGHTVVRRDGFLFAARERRWRYDEILRVEYAIYRIGTVPGSAASSVDSDADDRTIDGARRRLSRRVQLRYGFRTDQEELVQIEIRRVRNLDEERRIPEEIARHLDIPLERITV